MMNEFSGSPKTQSPLHQKQSVVAIGLCIESMASASSGVGLII
jgi:hypothetical protein